jgi:hypothetical protein
MVAAPVLSEYDDSPVSTNLGPIRTNLSPPSKNPGDSTGDKVREDRRLRFRMRDAAQSLTKSKGVMRCGRIPIGFGTEATVSLRVHRDSRRAYFSGLERCSNPWQCPVCVVRIQHARCAELRGLDRAHRAAAGGLVMATLTFPHDLANDLKPMKKAAVRAWQYCITGAPWQRQQRALGIIGYVRALEVTDGPNGWHLHFHTVLYLHRPAGEPALESFRAWLLARWQKAITRRKAYRQPSEAHGVTVEACRDASYIAKMGLAAELTLSGTKKARPGHRTPMQLLRDLTLTTNKFLRAQDAARFRDWCKAMHGARQLTWSAGMRKLAAWYQVSLTDKDEDLDATEPELGLPEQTPEPESVVLYEFNRDEWFELTAGRRSVWFRLQLLEVVEHPPDEWLDRVVKLLDMAQGREPAPF